MPRSQVAQSAAAPGARESAGAAAATAVTVGGFDGAHCGHAALIHAARAAVGPRGRVVALSLDPSPLTVLRPGSAPPRVSSFDQRARWLRELGADQVERLAPTRELLQQEPETFLAMVAARWQPGFVVEGEDFRFGRARSGSLDTLRALEARFGYRTIAVAPVEVVLCDQSVVRASSSLARWLIGAGRVRDAAIVLGRPFEMEAVIVPGDRRGRDIGFPTANLQPADDQLLPADGIYAGIAWGGAGGAGGGEPHAAAISVGRKPTFGQHPRVCEAHLLGFHGPLDDYGWTIRLRFGHWLRDQLTFSSVPALVEQMHRDIARVRQAGSGDDPPAAEANLLPGRSASAASA